MQCKIFFTKYMEKIIILIGPKNYFGKSCEDCSFQLHNEELFSKFLISLVSVLSHVIVNWNCTVIKVEHLDFYIPSFSFSRRKEIERDQNLKLV